MSTPPGADPEIRAAYTALGRALGLALVATDAEGTATADTSALAQRARTAADLLDLVGDVVISVDIDSSIAYTNPVTRRVTPQARLHFDSPDAVRAAATRLGADVEVKPWKADPLMTSGNRIIRFTATWRGLAIDAWTVFQEDTDKNEDGPPTPDDR